MLLASREEMTGGGVGGGGGRRTVAEGCYAGPHIVDFGTVGGTVTARLAGRGVSRWGTAGLSDGGNVVTGGTRGEMGAGWAVEEVLVAEASATDVKGGRERLEHRAAFRHGMQGRAAGEFPSLFSLFGISC